MRVSFFKGWSKKENWNLRDGCKLGSKTISGRCPDDVDMLETVANQIEGKTICAFGEACSWPAQSFVKKFRDELKADTKPENSGRIVSEESLVAAAGLVA